jgi:catechol 2,3-dioxygenase-like lactoylglutathione lyase family enzyme
MRMNHVGISVSNIDRTVAFYRDMFPFGGPDFSAVMGLDAAQGRMCKIIGGMKAVYAGDPDDLVRRPSW